MRTPSLCALALLFGAEVAHGQGWPANAYYTYPQGYGARYPTAQAPTSYYYPTGAIQTVSGYPMNYPGYAYYPNGMFYPNYYYPPSYPVSSGSAYSYSAPQPAPAALPASPSVPFDPSVGLGHLPEPEGEPVTKHHDWSWLWPGNWKRPIDNKIYASADGSLAWFRPEHLTAPLLTVGATVDQHPGALGQPGTGVLVGTRADFGTYYGVRGAVGMFLDSDNHWAVEAGGLWYNPSHLRFRVSSDDTGNPVIARPVFNGSTSFVPGNSPGQEVGFIDALPGFVVGGSAVDLRSEFYGVEMNGRYCMCFGDNLKVDALGGARFLRLAETLRVEDTFRPITPGAVTFLGVPTSPPETLSDTDSFGTRNHFYGAQVGGRVRYDLDWCFVSAYGKLGLGVTDQTVNINGSTTLVDATGNSHTVEGGVLALVSNIGQYHRSEFSYIPEGGINVGVKVTPNVQLSAGYTFLYWNNVVRPGAQIDHIVNPNLLPTDANYGVLAGPARPAFHFNDEAIWLSSLNLGVEVIY